MATGKQTKRLIVQLGNGADPEEFKYTCGANTYGITLTNNLGEDTVLDCDNPLDVPAEIIRHLDSQDISVTISGIVARDAFPTWRRWVDEGSVKNIKVILDESAANNGGFWAVPAIVGGFELSKENSKTVAFSATISGSGRRVWVDAT